MDKLSQKGCGYFCKIRWGIRSHIIEVVARGKLNREGDDIKYTRCWKQYSKGLLLTGLGFCDWSELYISRDVNVITEKLTNNIKEVLNVIAPIRKITNNRKYKSFISEETREVIRAAT